MEEMSIERGKRVFESRGIRDQEQHVEYIKNSAAVLWSYVDNIQIPPGNSEAGRLVALAKTDIESAVMWAVKALSRNA